MSTLTKKQKQIYDFIEDYINKKGYSPTFSEIKKKFKLSALSTVHQHIEALVKKGFISKKIKTSRSVELIKKAIDYVQVPILGNIAAGQPIEAIAEKETIVVPQSKLPKAGSFYALRVVGDSMIDEKINDGDIILVKHQKTAENGQKVVALIDNQEATLKKFYKENGHIRLQPANKKIEPIILEKDTPVEIQGIFIDIIKETPKLTPQTLFGDYELQTKSLTGYSIYNEEAKRRIKQNNLGILYPKLPNKQFDIIYADPPWHYNGKLQFDKSSKSKKEINLSKKIFISSATFKYPTLKTSELMEIPVKKITKDDCLLFMWTTNPHLSQAVALGEAWGFEYKTVVFVWDKMVHNPGQYTLSYCELCLLFKRGRIPRPRGARNVKQLIRAPRGEHSEKPVEALRRIEKMFPTQEKIELFARKKNNGWSVWGLDMLREYKKQS